VLLLPHGYEGAGPEHSSARLERFLDMSAEDNIQVCYPTSAGQFFHLLRRQALRSWRKPLVVMTPKSLLRREEAASPLSAFTESGWQRVIGDAPEVDPSRVTRLLLCSGKVAFDLMAHRTATKDDSVAVARVEQLYPVPRTELEALVKRYPSVRELFWVQEEPRNMGAWRFMRSHLADLVATAAQPVKVQYVGRVESPSPATGFLKTHELEQHVLVDEAFARGTA
jgi:2-oxoglutarate dehydrogenase E1 component